MAAKNLNNIKFFFNLDDCINANYNYQSSRCNLVSQPNSNKNNKNFTSSTQKDIVFITFGELFPEDKICKKTQTI